MGGLAALAVVPAPFLASLPQLCPLGRVVSIGCPTCGLTRATNALLHLDLVGAAHHNPLSFLLVGALASRVTWLAVPERARRAVPRQLPLTFTLVYFGLAIARWVLLASG